MLVFWWVRRYGRGAVPSAPATTIPSGSRRSNHGSRSGGSTPWWRSWLRKYVIACAVCGGLSVCHGVVFIVIYLFLRNYTSSLQFFETIPTYVPGVIFIITGLIFMCLAKRRNRYAFLMKVAGGCGLVCALLCVVMTVTTTVIHMNRLQTLHECVYTPQSRTCMCVSAIGDHNAQEAHRFVFNGTPSCEVVHGSLYACLRALFSFSVLGILLCIACSMLVYQLLSHEKKRLYFEQLELRRRFLYQRHSHQNVCGCYDQLYPWQVWDMIDYRFLPSHNNNVSNGGNGNEENANNTSATTRSAPRNSSGHQRSFGWNWLPWPRIQHSERNRPRQEERTEVSRQNLLNRLVSRDTWNQQVINMDNTTEDPFVPSDSVESLPWRSECIHIFRPNGRNSNCFPHMRFGMRPRNSPYGRHRRARSNDGVFHHLHMAPRYSQPYSLVDANGGVCFTGCEIPRYMWGPPPPYSQPSSIENLALYGESQLQRRSGLTLEPMADAREMNRCNQVLTALEIDRTRNDSISSKLSTPLSERRYVCHNFSSEGITLTMGGDYSNLITHDGLSSEHKKEDTCIVEVHVPYILNKDLVFNTLPARSSKKREGNPFKSLSNIPLGLSCRVDGLQMQDPNSNLISVIKACCDLEVSNCNGTSAENASSQPHCDEQNAESEDSIVYSPTLVEVPSEFKSSLAISTSPDFTLTSKVYGTQSMPNLNTSGTLSMVRHLRRVPSSGNTSVSQDFGDFEFEDDYSSPLVVCSPVSDVQSLPNDESDSSSSFPPCPRLFRNEFETPISNGSMNADNDSDSSSCGVIVMKDRETSEHRSEGLFQSSPTIIITSKRSPIECPINCAIRHLHNYHPDKIEVRTNQANDRTNDFIVTIKSVNV